MENKKYEFIENSNKSRTYNAQKFFEDYGLEDVVLTPVKNKSEKPEYDHCVMLNVRGEGQNGLIFDYDLWPRADMTDDEIKSLAKKHCVKAHIRIGVYENEETGELVEAREPKALRFFFDDGTCIDLADGRDARPYLGD